MAYSSGSTILDDDYNIFVTGNASGTGDDNTANVNTVWGGGTGNKGYGQSGTLSSVSAGNTITATQWSSLLNRVSSLANHQGTSITAITNPTVGDTIEAYNALSSNITAVFNNRLDAAANGSDITSGGSVTGTTSWYTQAETTTTVSFSSANAARYFFNAGGMIRLDPVRSGTNNSKSSEWNDLASDVGTIAFTNGSTATIAGVTYSGTDKLGGSGTVSSIADNTGFYDLTPGGSSVLIFKQFADSSPYTANYIEIRVSLNSASTELTFTMTFRDDAADEPAPTFETDPNPELLDQVQGTTGSTTVVRPPSTTYISNTWGTPSISSSISYITS